MAYRARNNLIAVALAAVAALLTSFYVTCYKRHVQRCEDHVTVLVAKHDIDEGTTGGDAVDVVATFKYHRAGQSGDTFFASRVVLRDLAVLRAPAGPAVGSKLTNGLQQDFSVLVAVTDQQAQKLLFTLTQTGSASQGNGSGWSLQLRPVVHADDSPESVTTLDSVLRDGLSSAQLKKYRGVFGGGQ